MRLQQYSILQISAQAILKLARKTEDGYRFCFDTNDATKQFAIQRTMQDDCAMFHQLRALVDQEGGVRVPDEEKLQSAIVYLDFTGIFDRRLTGYVEDLQKLAEWLFRPEGIEFVFYRGPVRFVAFERSASMSRNNRLSFVRADLYDRLWERMTLGMQIGQCQLAKLYAYNGLMFTSGQEIPPSLFRMDADRIIVVDNPHSIVKDVPVVTVEDDGKGGAVRTYHRVERTEDVSVLEFDGEGLISTELGSLLDPYSHRIHDHHSFQIRMPYIKGVVHEVDFHALFAELGVTELVDIDGVRHPVSRVEMILTKSMCKGWGWMKENDLTWAEYLRRCRDYGHSLFVSNMDRRSRDGLTELNFQLLNTAAISAEEYRPGSLSMGWERSPEASSQTWLTKATETAYFNTLCNPDWQLSYFVTDRDNLELEITDRRRKRAELLYKNPAFLAEQIFQKELERKAQNIREKYAVGKLMVPGDTRYLSDDLMRLLAVIVRPSSEAAYEQLSAECLQGAEVYAPQPSYKQTDVLAILRNPHISRNEEALVRPVSPGPLRKKYLSHLYYVAMVDSRSLIADRLGGADYDGDTVHLYAEPLLNRSILRNYNGGIENEHNLPLLKIPSAEPLIADAHDWQARFQTVRSTFSSRVGQISNAALWRSILAYDEATPPGIREAYRKETEILTILTGLEIDSAKSGIKPNLHAYLGRPVYTRNIFLRYKDIAGEPEEHEWYEPTKNQRFKAYFSSIRWDQITANLERTPYYARQLGLNTKAPAARPAESTELFSFAADPHWKDKLDPDTMERMRTIISEYKEAKRRCEAWLHRTASGNYRQDVQRILFSQNREDELSVEALYRGFDHVSAYEIRNALDALRDSDWIYTPPEKRTLMLYTIFRTSIPDNADVLCDFRSSGYRLLGDILMDLNEQFEAAKKQKRKGIYEGDSMQMRTMMCGLVDSPDYRKQLIRNCINVLSPIRQRHMEHPPILFDEAVKCAEALGERGFILEVLPAAALDLAIDRSPQGSRRKQPAELEEEKRGGSFVERIGRILGLH